MLTRGCTCTRWKLLSGDYGEIKAIDSYGRELFQLLKYRKKYIL